MLRTHIISLQLGKIIQHNESTVEYRLCTLMIPALTQDHQREWSLYC